MAKLTQTELFEKAKQIKLIVMDVDGVLTDGRIIYSSDGVETKCFNVRDGHGIAVARMAGLAIAWISGRDSKVTTLRAKELGIEHVYQGKHDKLTVLAELTGKLGIAMESVLFMGDDVIDIPAMEACAIGIAPADAHPAVLASADWITTNKGGHGAVREVTDLVLSAQK